ncbi:response regulator [Methanoregula sp.]|uniref:response regulator n=1 Tax=Methanoregula sp. TaxID=2052170 RepID=UPI00262104A5|nr:response regulator [Methanoregula sp.]MDD5141999.1 PAS domain S-box protein [Methanoregula sp.]
MNSHTRKQEPPADPGHGSYTPPEGNESGTDLPISVLYVDDEPSLLEPTKLSLEKQGRLFVDTTTSARSAGEMMEKHAYDVIVSDYQMPGTDGIVFLQQLRKEGNTIPFIIFTGKGREDAVIEAYNSGADFYLAKGGTPKAMFLDLTHKIEQVVNRRRTENALKRSEEKYRAIFEALDDLYYRTDMQGIIQTLSPSCRKLTGFDPATLIGHSVLELYPDPEQRQQLVDELLLNGAVHDYEIILKNKDGVPRHVTATSHVVRDASGSPVAIEGILHDVTDRKQMEAALVASEEKYRTLADFLPVMVFETDREGRATFANRLTFPTFGITPADIVNGINILDHIVIEEREDAKQGVKELFRGRERIPREYTLVKKDGSRFPALIRSTAIHDWKSQTITGIRGVVIDLTEQKKQESALKEAYSGLEQKVTERTHELSELTESLKKEIAEKNRVMEALTTSEEKYRTLVEQIGDIVFHVDPSGLITYISPHVLGDIDNPQAPINVIDIAPAEYRRQIHALIDPSAPSHDVISGFELPLLLSVNVRTVLYEINATPTFDKENAYTGYSGIARNITERKNLQNAIAASLLEKETLLKEIHHRVKNNMQVISSLLNLQIRLMKDEKSREALLESQNRVMSIALVHEKLYQSKSFAEIDFRDYLMKISENLMQSFGVPRGKVRVDIRGENVVLPLEKAIPVSLIVNELLSNAFKYAYPNERTGTILVSLQQDGNRYTLLIRDDGIGLPESVTLDNIETLGLQLVVSLVGQLVGTIALDRSNGTEFSIEFTKEMPGG